MVRGIVLILLLLEGVARADDPLAQARQAVAESDYAAAQPALGAALEAGGHSPEELAEIYRLTGIVGAALGDTRAATEAFIRWLTLSPRATLADGTSPKIRRPFDAAAAYVAGHGVLEIRADTAASPPAITLVVVSDPIHMVATVRAEVSADGGAERTLEAEASERTELALPPGRRFTARVAALDVYGNRLAAIGSADAPIVIGEAPAPVVRETPRPVVTVVQPAARPIYLRWWPYAAAGAAALGATTYFGLHARHDADELDALRADSSHHTAGALQTAEDRARRSVLLTNLGFGVTGALAIAAGVMYLTTPRDRVETRITAVPVTGGGAVVLGGTF